mmetsp:Transcript_32423/g.60298  ORF Transcript_32423/g.60298 Transcript_32423/m.60298 type:complete len:103 (-) Transcript_32423:167-475(-)
MKFPEYESLEGLHIGAGAGNHSMFFNHLYYLVLFSHYAAKGGDDDSPELVTKWRDINAKMGSHVRATGFFTHRLRNYLGLIDAMNMSTFTNLAFADEDDDEK